MQEQTRVFEQVILGTATHSHKKKNQGRQNDFVKAQLDNDREITVIYATKRFPFRTSVTVYR